VDPLLAGALPATVAERAGPAAHLLRVVTGDALVVPVPGAPTALVANLPYNVAVPVLLRLWADVPSLQRGLVMVQREVADRLAAPPGSRLYGVPSVKIAWDAEVRAAGSVSRTVFWPVPNVDSGLVALTRRPPPPCLAPRSRVFAIVDAAFGQRRKMVRSSLAPLLGAERVAAVLETAGVDPAARPERLAIEDFARIADAADGP
jgi:16S rRNA (adenine1518-N6/adenine1519-N6)-dimethyltransferase